MRIRLQIEADARWLKCYQITRIIDDCLPNARGYRHDCLFRLTRSLKGLPEYADSPANDLREIVQAWHAKAEKNLGAKNFETSWWDFEESWDSVRFPIGSGIVTQAAERAATEPLPAAAKRYESESIRRLIATCRQLQIAAGSQSFFLSARNAAEFLNEPPSTVSLWMRGLCRERVLKLKKRGELEGRKASEYYYLPPLEE